ncbi:MAG: V-type ATP synthase subunit E [Candidatus Micrarchaeia archaeon]
MGFEDILADINSHKEKELESIKRAIDSETSAIIEKAKKEASEYEAETRKKAEDEAARIIASEVSKANMEARRIIEEAVEAQVGKAKRMLSEYLSEYISTDSYAKLLGVLAERAHKEADCNIFVQKRDLKYLKDANVADRKFIGGLVAVSKDGKMEIDYTLEHMLSDMDYELSMRLAKMLKVKR